MKKIIKLTELDITNIIKRTIMELNKSTYDSASKIAYERGFKRLSNKFSEHGKELGYIPSDMRLNLVFNAGPSDDEHIFADYEIIEIQRNDDLKNSIIITLDSSKSSSIKKLYVNKSERKIDFYLNNKFECLPEKRKDAKLILKLLSEQGVNVGDVDLRSITYEDSGF